MLKQIVSYVKNQTSGFTVGTNLFAGFAPATAQNDVVVVRQSGGLPDFDKKDSVELAVQVLSRASSYWTARTNALKVFTCLHGIAGITLPVIDAEAYYLNDAQATTAPQDLGQDEKGLYNISTNYIIRIENA